MLSSSSSSSSRSWGLVGALFAMIATVDAVIQASSSSPDPSSQGQIQLFSPDAGNLTGLVPMNDAGQNQNNVSWTSLPRAANTYICNPVQWQPLPHHRLKHPEHILQSDPADKLRRLQWEHPGARCTQKRADRKSTRLNSSHSGESRMPSSA